jgi:hypothetical protein
VGVVQARLSRRLSPNEQETFAAICERVYFSFQSQGALNAVCIFRHGCAGCKQHAVALQNTDWKNRMSRPQKIIPPIKGNFNDILKAVAMGSGNGKIAAKELARNPVIKATEAKPKK